MEQRINNIIPINYNIINDLSFNRKNTASLKIT